MQEPRKAQRRGRPSECISRFGVFFWGGEEIRRAYARGGEELARDRRDRAVHPAASEERGARMRVFQQCCQCGRRLRKRGREGVSPGDLPPLFLARVHASVGTNGSAARARRASAGSSAVLAFCVVCPERCGRDFERLRFPSASGGCAQGGEKNRQTVKHGLPWRKAAPSEMAARRSGRRIRSCWSCRARCGSCAAPCS